VIDDVLRSLESTSLAGLVRGDVPAYVQWEGWVFPFVEVVHVLAISMVFGSIFMVDIRLLGLGHRDTRVTALSRAVLPWTWVAFAVAALSGSTMFISKASTYFYNVPFRLKFLVMALAAINMLAFHFDAYRTVEQWNTGPSPRRAQVAGALSILLWLGVIYCGRWVGFTT
jgi:hypothetical protein